MFPVQLVKLPVSPCPHLWQKATQNLAERLLLLPPNLLLLEAKKCAKIPCHTHKKLARQKSGIPASGVLGRVDDGQIALDHQDHLGGRKIDKCNCSSGIRKNKKCQLSKVKSNLLLPFIESWLVKKGSLEILIYLGSIIHQNDTVV